MNKSLQLALCDTQGKLFELSGTVGYESESFAKAFMTTDVAADMDKDFNHIQWAGKSYILSRMEDECKERLKKVKFMIRKPYIGWGTFTAIGISTQERVAVLYTSKPLQRQCERCI